MDTEKTFSQWKKQCLSKVDYSKKGSVDEGIAHVVGFLNEYPDYFTTSSCSGRLILIDGVSDSPEVQKRNCSWLFATHQKCRKEDLVSGLEKAGADAVFKFEPFVLHVQCRRLGDAQLLHSVAVNSGFRNSGITVGKRGKIIMAVRSTHGLEVPLSRKGQTLVKEEYLDFLVELANQKMEENQRRIERFYSSLQSAVRADSSADRSTGLTQDKSVSTRKKKSAQECSREATAQDLEDVILLNGDNGLEDGLHLFM
ncbi:tRNA wybutosine-synthesizing protein 3 homolog [Lepisosteus oculatus]|uniref:tRNA wybutosine-synthesizing protein 3 homolog n=1 Tax=Lepisosteus oculatus TaxID=7918 RepID=UPI00372480CF